MYFAFYSAISCLLLLVTMMGVLAYFALWMKLDVGSLGSWIDAFVSFE
jgi:hypothetical protein